MKNLKNCVRLIGHLSQDPAVRVLESGNKKASFSLVTNETYKNDKGEKVVDTQWHNLVMSGKVAEFAEELLKKGNEIVVEGRLTHGEYLDGTGKKRYVTEINVDEFLKLGSKM